MNILLANMAKMVNDSGGLSKVTCAFANEMAQKGHNVTLIYSDDKEGDFFFPVDERVRCHNLRHFQGHHHIFPLSYKVKREVLRAFDGRRGRAVNNAFTRKYLANHVNTILKQVHPDVIIASQPAATEIFISVLNTDIPVITMSHGNPEDYFHSYPQEEIPGISRSAACQVLLPSFVEPLISRYPDLKTVVIGNVVPQYEEQADLCREKDVYKIVTIGRFVKNHKRPHLLIEAFAKLAEEFPEWQVELWGAEDTKKYTVYLKSLITKYQLESRVFLKGTTRNVAKVLVDADIFVFPSAYEGFGLTMAEAMSMGVPVIGYKNCVAVNEIIHDGENGFLADDGVEPLAEKMRLLMEDVALRAKMGQAARRSMKQYSADKIWGAWEKLIHEVSRCMRDDC